MAFPRRSSASPADPPVRRGRHPSPRPWRLPRSGGQPWRGPRSPGGARSRGAGGGWPGGLRGHGAGGRGVPTARTVSAVPVPRRWRGSPEVPGAQGLSCRGVEIAPGGFSAAGTARDLRRRAGRARLCLPSGQEQRLRLVKQPASGFLRQELPSPGQLLSPAGCGSSALSRVECAKGGVVPRAGVTVAAPCTVSFASVVWGGIREGFGVAARSADGQGEGGGQSVGHPFGFAFPVAGGSALGEACRSLSALVFLQDL